jgi:hypothetical protein
MKAIGKIVAFLFLIFVLTGISLVVQEILGIRITRLTVVGAFITCYGAYFFTYSKWANDNIWNTKTSKPANTSYTSSKDVVEPIDEPVDDNHDILSNIKLPPLSNPEENNNDVLQKIEELKRQIESLESSLKTNDSNKLPEEKIDYGEYWKKREKFNPDDFKPKMKDEDMNMYVSIAIVILILVCFLLIIAQMELVK